MSPVMPDDEAVRLTMPADADMRPVVVAAVGAVAKAAGLGSTAQAEVRDKATQAVDDVLAQGTGDTMELTAWARRLPDGGHQTFFELETEGWRETYEERSGG